MRLLVISLEFSCKTFSGNGIYCRSQGVGLSILDECKPGSGAVQVRSLAALGHELFVIAGRPHDADDPASAPKEGACHLFQVPLPTWGRLDRGSAWETFAAGMDDVPLLQQVASFRPHFVLGIDWSSLPAYRALVKALATQQPEQPTVPYVFMNYRVYARSADSDEDVAFHLHWEREAMDTAVLDTALSRSDAEFLEQKVGPPGHPRSVKVLLPALRSDMEALPAPDIHPAHLNGSTNSQATAKRNYLLCCVRLSPEKEPSRFVALVEELQRRGVFDRTGVVPMLVGPATTPYATELKERLRTACRTQLRIEEQFMGPAQLAEVYKQTVLNVHPCVYDAYGMTIVEAASQGAPSLVQQGGSVGATDLLQSTKQEVILADLDVSCEALADVVEKLLTDPALLSKVGGAACARARSWTERDNAAALIAELEVILQSSAR